MIKKIDIENVNDQLKISKEICDIFYKIEVAKLFVKTYLHHIYYNEIQLQLQTPKIKRIRPTPEINVVPSKKFLGIF